MRLKSPQNDGSDKAKEFYGAFNRGSGTSTARRRRGPSIMEALSLRPDVGRHFMVALRLGHFDSDGALSAETKQMIATYTAALRSCVY